MSSVAFTPRDVKHIASLARIPLQKEEEQKLADGFNTTMNVVDKLAKVATRGIEPTHQVTGLENVLRDDEIDVSRTFTQEQALANAPKTHNGFFVAEAVQEQEE